MLYNMPCKVFDDLISSYCVKN